MEGFRKARSVRLTEEEARALMSALAERHAREYPDTRMTRAHRSELLGISPRTIDRMLAGDAVDRTTVAQAFHVVGLVYGKPIPAAPPTEDVTPPMPPEESGAPSIATDAAATPPADDASEPVSFLRRWRWAVVAVGLVGIATGVVALRPRVLPSFPSASAARPVTPSSVDVEPDPLNRLDHLYHAARYDEAAQLGEEVIEQARRTGELGRVAAALSVLAEISAFRGDYEGGVAQIREAIRLRRETGEAKLRGPLYAKLGDIYAQWGRIPDARAAYTNALEGLKDLDDLFGAALVQADLGSLAFREGDYTGAEAWYDAAQAHFQTYGREAELTDVLARRAMLHHANGQHDEAAALLDRCLQFWTRRGHPRWIAKTHLQRAIVAGDAGDLATAAEHLEKARAGYEGIPDPRGLARVEETAAKLRRP